MIVFERQKTREKVFEDDYSYIEHKDGNWTEGGAKQHLLAGSQVRGRERKQTVVVQHGQCGYLSFGASSRAGWPCRKFRVSCSNLNIQEELVQAEAYGPKTRARLWKGNPSEAKRDEHKATQPLFPSWCTCCVEGQVSEQLDCCCSSDRDVPETQTVWLLLEPRCDNRGSGADDYQAPKRSCRQETLRRLHCSKVSARLELTWQ